ncbi:MAG: phosphatidate cytidylyltransferase [Pirellulaceae bacterium]
MLRWRLMAAAAMLTPLIALLVVDFCWNGGAPGVWLVMPGWAVASMVTAEVLTLVRATGARPVGWAAYVGVSLLFLSACVPMGTRLGASTGVTLLEGQALVLAASVLATAVAFAAEMRRFEGATSAITDLASVVFTTMYVGLGFSFAALLRQMHGNAWGMAALLSVVWIIKWSDTGAYFVGKAWGRRKLSPQLSPGKTVEGAAGGLVSAALASWVFFYFLVPWLTGDKAFAPSWPGVAAYGVSLAAMGLLGDLAESLLKRAARQKDSSSWLPGLGGLLDVMDSLLLAMPVAYWCWELEMLGK